MTLIEIQDQFIADWQQAMRCTARYGNRRRACRAAWRKARMALVNQGWTEKDARVAVQDAHEVADLQWGVVLAEIAVSA